jgi:hypothetical protein
MGNCCNRQANLARGRRGGTRDAIDAMIIERQGYDEAERVTE